MFSEQEWKTPYWEDPMDVILSSADQLYGDIEDQRAHLAFCLRRAFKGHTPSYESVQRTILLPAHHFKDFDIQIRHNFHDRVHNVIGGTMCTHYAGNTPEFHMHHSFLDKIWYKWQQISSDHKWVHFLQRNHSKMMGTEYTQFEYTNTDDLPRCIKVKYRDFPIKQDQNIDLIYLQNKQKTDIGISKRHINIDSVNVHIKQDNDIDFDVKHVRSKRTVDIDSMGRMSDSYWEPYLQESWYNTFPNCSRSKKEKRRANYLHKILDGPGPIVNIIP